MPEELSFLANLIPNRSSEQRARKLARASAWKEAGSNSRLIWGKCRSRGTRYFHTVAEVARPVYYCNCSAKRPCSHVLALYLLFASGSDAIRSDREIPDWVIELRSRMQGHEVVPEPVSDEEADARREARLGRRAKRIEGMREGLASLEEWMADVLRQGLARLADAPADLWEDLAARLTDAKLSSLARRVRQMARLIGQPNWYEDLLDAFGQLYLLIRAYDHLENLSPDLQYELLGQGGLALRKEEILEEPAVSGEWLLCGQVSGTEEDLRFRRAWFYEPSRRQFGLLLDFAWGDRPFDRDWTTGRIYSGEAHYYPAALARRFILEPIDSNPLLDISLPALKDWNALYDQFARDLGRHPWLLRMPAIVQGIPHFSEGDWQLVDEVDQVIPMYSHNESEWTVLALSGGNPVTLFGEWDGSQFAIISVVDPARILQL